MLLHRRRPRGRWPEAGGAGVGLRPAGRFERRGEVGRRRHGGVRTLSAGGRWQRIPTGAASEEGRFGGKGATGWVAERQGAGREKNVLDGAREWMRRGRDDVEGFVVSRRRYAWTAAGLQTEDRTVVVSLLFWKQCYERGGLVYNFRSV